MKELKEDKFSWVFFAASAKPTFLQRALAERIGEKEKVILVNLAVSVHRERFIPALHARALPLQGNKNIIHYRPLHFPEELPVVGRIFKALNEKLIQREIDKLLPPQMDRTVCYDSPSQYPLVRKFRERQSVYLAIDDRTLTVSGDRISGEVEAESRLLGKVDRVICVIEALAKTLKSRTPQGRTPPIFVLPNGYDERIFDSSMNYAEADFLKNVPRPRILIAGHVSERIDWDGIAAGSLLRPDWTWIFLGPADSGMKERISNRLGNNGFYHSPISIQDVPAWIHHCDACGVPYRLNRFTLASHPLKAIEYLAMGAPVLSTRIPSLETYNWGIEWVNEGDGESYARTLDKFANITGSQEICSLRRLAVSGNSLGARVDHFRKIVFDAIS
jgi:glycosyltransferase involved in cell wall biosynthesis